MHSPQAQQVFVETPLASVSRMGSSQALDCMSAFARLLDRRARAVESVISNHADLAGATRRSCNLITRITVSHRKVA